MNQEWVVIIENNSEKIILEIDTRIFPIDIVLKACYEFIDEINVWFKFDNEFIQVILKYKTDLDIEEFKNIFTEELIFHKLREQINQQSGEFRVKMIETAIWFWLSYNEIKSDLVNMSNRLWMIFWEMQNNQPQNSNIEQKQDESIESIIKSIEEDPSFKEDKEQIIWILKQIK